MARLLKRKLKLCVSEIVQRNQVGFIQERLLSENVLLATELVKDFNAPGMIISGC
ncbi:BnaA01g18310D [Brassica napus]|uniref:BnaA01g18310D protein n=1 Tax=Brassica napus TaxID=3708 RepID=A0A078GE27_BRANA|nr:BnaA01g18310D [Brassica napus]